MESTFDEIDARARRPWAILVVIGAALLLVLAGVRHFGGTEVTPETVALPVPLEPQGDLDLAPTLFRWTPGDEDAIAQVLIHLGSYDRHWSSGPVRGGVLEVPVSVYQDINPEEGLYWRVREARHGKPSGSSAFVAFRFAYAALDSVDPEN